ncbi:unnamed protein product [Closterium sp. NIES-54]
MGFNLSPVLWRKLPGCKSAGRVQSVALRFVCEREGEVAGFNTQEYWTVSAMVQACQTTKGALLESSKGLLERKLAGRGREVGEGREGREGGAVGAGVESDAPLSFPARLTHLFGEPVGAGAGAGGGGGGGAGGGRRAKEGKEAKEAKEEKQGKEGDENSVAAAAAAEVEGGIRDGERALAAAVLVEGSELQVQGVHRSQTRRSPSPPFTTSSMQQEASSKLGFSPSRTMAVSVWGAPLADQAVSFPSFHHIFHATESVLEAGVQPEQNHGAVATLRSLLQQKYGCSSYPHHPTFLPLPFPLGYSLPLYQVSQAAVAPLYCSLLQQQYGSKLVSCLHPPTSLTLPFPPRYPPSPYQVSQTAVASLRSLLQQKYGSKLVSPSPRVFASKARNAQEAHEAIRPTHPHLLPGTVWCGVVWCALVKPDLSEEPDSKALFVHAPCLCCLLVLPACAPCLCCLLVLPACAACLCCLLVLPACAACLCCLLVLPACAACLCCLLVLPSCAACLCCLLVLPACAACFPVPRPTPTALVKPDLSEEQWKLYALVWARFAASQMANAVYDRVAVDISAYPLDPSLLSAFPSQDPSASESPSLDPAAPSTSPPAVLRANAFAIAWPGFLAAYSRHPNDDLRQRYVCLAALSSCCPASQRLCHFLARLFRCVCTMRCEPPGLSLNYDGYVILTACLTVSSLSHCLTPPPVPSGFEDTGLPV